MVIDKHLVKESFINIDGEETALQWQTPARTRCISERKAAAICYKWAFRWESTLNLTACVDDKIPGMICTSVIHQCVYISPLA